MTKKETLEAALRGEGCLGRSQDDEPVFVLCARDALATSTIQDWVRRATTAHVNERKITDALVLGNEMDAWRRAHGGGKVPD